MFRTLLGLSALLFLTSAAPSLAPVAQAAASLPQDISVIAIPVTASLQTILPQIEAQVPKTLAKSDYEVDQSGRIAMRYNVQRDPIRLQMIGAGLHATTTIHYSVEACKRTGNPINDQVALWPCASCGFEETPRTVDIKLQTKLDVDPAWKLRSTTRPLQPYFANRCQVTMLNVDITDFGVAPFVNGSLRDAARSIDTSIPKITNFRRDAEKVWAGLQAPTQIAPRTWLVMEPIDFAVGPIGGTGTNITTTLLLRARTRVVVGDRPAATVKPLPPLRTGTGGNSFTAPLHVELSYTEATRILNEQVAGKSSPISGGSVVIHSLELSPGDAGRLRITADLEVLRGKSRRYNGLVFFEGAPQFDPATRTLSVRNLDYAIDRSRNGFLTRIIERSIHDSIRSNIASAASWPLSGQLDAMRKEVTAGLNRTVSPGVTLGGSVDTIDVQSLNVLPLAIDINAVARGKASIQIR